MSSTKPTVVVFGATGSQGGSVLRTLAESADYNVRAVTRSKSSKNAQELASKYPAVELVEADLDDIATLRAAVSGAQIVFGVTQFFQPSILGAVEENVDAEFEQGKRLVDASVAEGVEFIVFSTLPSAAKLSSGEITKVLHFEGKYKIQQYLFSQPIKGAAVQLSSYYQNNLQSPQWAEDGETLLLGLPVPSDIKVPHVDVDRDTGPYVKYIIDNRETSDGQVFPLTSGYYSQNEIAEAFTAATGIKAKAFQVPLEYLPSDDLRAMFSFFSKNDMFAEVPNHQELRKNVPHSFTTPVEFWKATGYRGPAKE
ncbi:hypothetical protein GGI12_002392 [Dipsacomyces acuminosporus]|nr:hypothetical protein GGI12_002392 [Dipsacomyces acuminosporus]